MGFLYEKIKQNIGIDGPVESASGLYNRVAENVNKKATQPQGSVPLQTKPDSSTRTSTKQFFAPGERTPAQETETFAKAMGQGIARAWASTGTRLARDIGTTKSDVVDPKTFFGYSDFGKTMGEIVFGRNEPFNATSEDIEFLESFGVDQDIAKGTAGGLTMALTALDLTGAGGAPKGLSGAIKALRAVKTAEEALRFSKSIGLADDIAEQFSEAFIRARTAKEAKEALEAASKLQNTTKLVTEPSATVRSLEGAKAKTEGLPTQKIAPKTQAKVGSTPAMSDNAKNLEPLAIEARKYKSAEVKKFFDQNYGKLSSSDQKQLDKIIYGMRGEFYGDVVLLPKEQKLLDRIMGNAQDISRSSPVIRKPQVKEVAFPTFSEYYKHAGGYRAVTEGMDTRGDYIKGVIDTLEGKRTDFGKVTPEIVEDTRKMIEIHSLNKQRDLSRLDDAISKSQLTDIWNKANKIETKEVRMLPIPENLPPVKRPPSAKKILGQEPPRKITKTESQLLKDRIKSEARGAKEGYKAGKVEARTEIVEKLRATQEATDSVKKQIVDYVKENLDTKDRGKALTLVRDAKTQKDLTKAFSRIDRWAENAEKISIKNEVLNLQKKIMDSPSVAIDYKARVKELMGDFELKGHREDTLKRLEKTREFLESEAAKGNDIEMPRRVLKSLEILNRTPFEEITINQLQGLKAEMELLEDLGRTKLGSMENIWEANKTKIIDEVKTQGVKPIENIELIKPEIGERLTVTQKFKNLVWKVANQASRIDRAISPMDTMFDLLDGGKGTYNGANFRFFKGQVDAGYGRYISRKDALQEPVVELAIKHKLDDTNFERMGIVAAREQDGGMDKLIASGFTEDQVNAVILNTQEKEVLDLMRSTFDSQFPEIQDTMRRVYNQPVEKVKNYFSFMTDWKAMDESQVFERFGSQSAEQYGTPRKNVEAGFTKSRIGGDQVIKINAMDVFMQHTDNTSYLVELGETSKMLGEVAASPSYGELVGDAGQLMVREWLDVIARKGGASGASQIAVLDTLRKNVGAGILGLKLSTVAIQPTALIDGMGFIGAGYGTKGFTNFAVSSDWRKFVMGMPEISDRLGGEFALRELSDDNWLQNIQRKGFVPMQTLDQMTAGSIAAGAYERKMSELGRAIEFSKYDPEALAYAQLAVRRTQSSGSFKDVPLAVSRGALTGNRSLDRAILQFQNFLLTRWSRVRHDAIRAGINTKDPTKAIPIFTSIVMAAIAGSAIRLGVNRTIDFLTGNEDDDSVTEDLMSGFTYEMTGNVPFLGTITSMVVYDGEMFPILDAPKGAIEGLGRVITSDSESAKLRGLTQFSGSMGSMLGIPGSAQAEQLVRKSIKTEKSSGKTKSMKTPPGLPKLPSLNKKLPTLPGLPAL